MVSFSWSRVNNTESDPGLQVEKVSRIIHHSSNEIENGRQILTLPMLRLFYKDAKIFENHLNPVMLVFIR